MTVTGDVVQGNASTVLLRAGENADLVVVGSRGFTGLLPRYVSMQVLHHLPCPVLMVRTRFRTGDE